MSAVKEMGEAIEFVCAVANAIADSMSDGKISIGDAAHLVPLLYKLPSAVDGLDGVKFSELSPEDLALLNQKVKDSLSLPNQPKAELLVEGSLEVATQLYNLVQKLKA